MSASLGLAAFLPAAEPAAPAPPTFPMDAYVALGSNFAQNTRLAELGWTDVQFEAFVDGLRATFHGSPKPFDTQARLLHEAISRRLQALAEEAQRAREKHYSGPEGIEEYMKDAAKNFKLQRSDSGLAFGLMSRGGGARPGPDDTVVVTYNAVSADAQTELPALSAQRRRVKVADLLPGLAEGVQMMTIESSALLVLPPDLSYGTGAWPAEVSRGSPLIFSVNLHEIIAAP
jgi:FKBP-type peptidyl-prolyl cis-trans isomerase